MEDGRIAPRSGLAVKSFIDTGAGVIDADYRGQVKVLLFNHSDADFEGERCTMMIAARVCALIETGSSQGRRSNRPIGP